jgi:hypothetical protein
MFSLIGIVPFGRVGFATAIANGILLKGKFCDGHRKWYFQRVDFAVAIANYTLPKGRFCDGRRKLYPSKG